MTSVDVHDGRTRWLLVVCFGAYREGSGLAPLRQVEREVNTVRATFRQLGYQDQHHRTWVDRPVDEVRGEVYDVLAGLGPDDVVALHVTGHGELVNTARGAQLFIHASTSTAGQLRDVLTVDALLPGLSTQQADRQLARMLVVIDICEAAAGLTGALDGIRTWLDGGAVGRTPVSVVATARTGVDAVTGAFATALRTAVEQDLTDRSRPYLRLGGILDRAGALLRRQPIDHIDWRATETDLALPNPRHHVEGVDWADLRDWWEPRARASQEQVVRRGPVAEPDPGWYFTGRTEITEHLIRWAEDPDGAPVMVITAGPGRGKSSVLARLVALTVPDVRRSWAAQADPQELAGAPDPAFRLTASIYARQLPVAAIRRRVVAALGVDTDTDLGRLPARTDGRPVLAVDAVDEAEDPARLVREVLAPLARSASQRALRLIVATRTAPIGYERPGAARRSMDLCGPLLVDGHDLVELDEPRWLRQGDIAAYADMLLALPTSGGRPNPWRDAPAQRAELARAIEARSRGSFLLAGLVARRHTHDRERTDPTSPAWQEQFPEDIGIALRDELEAAFGYVEARRLRALLRPLALAPGAGLARERVGSVDLWAALATVLTPDVGPFTGSEVDDLLDNRAATHLIASSDAAGTPTYRLHHQALVDHFAPSATGRPDHSAVFGELRELLRAPDGTTEWTRATRYHLRALPAHAAAAGRLPELTTDARALVHLDPERLFAAVRGDREPSSVTASTLLGPWLHRLATANVRDRTVLLALVAANGPADSQLRVALCDLATAAGITLLASAIRSSTRSIVLSQAPPLGPTSIIIASAADRQPLLLVVDGSSIDVHSPDDLELLDTLNDHTDPVADLLVIGDTTARTLLASVDTAGGIRTRDLLTAGGAGVRDARPGGLPRSAAGHSADGRPLLAVSTTGGIVVLHPDTGQTLWSEPAPSDHDFVIALATVTRPAHDDLLAVAHRDRVQLVRLEDGEQVDELALPGAVSPSLSAGAVPGHDGVLLVLDPTTGLLGRWWPDGHLVQAAGDEMRPTCAAVHPFGDDLLAIVGGLDGDVELWDAREPARIRSLRHGGGTINDVQVLPAASDRPALCSALDRFGQLDLWRWGDGNWLTTHRPADEVHGVALGRHGDGEPYAATVGSGGIRLWELTQSAIQVTPDLHTGRIVDLALVPDHHGAPAVATLGADADIRLWDAASGALLSIRPCPPDPAARLLVRSDVSGLRAVWAGDSGIIDTALTGTPSQLALPIGPVHAIAAAGPDRLLIGLRDHAQLRDAATGTLLAELAAGSGALQFVAAATTGDGVVAALGTDSGDLTVWRWTPGDGATQMAHDEGPPVQIVRATAQHDGAATVVAGSRRGVLRYVTVRPDGTQGRRIQRIADENDVVTGLYVGQGGGVGAARTNGRGAVLVRWRDGRPLERVVTDTPLHGLTGPVHWRGHRAAVGITDNAVVLLSLDGEFATEEIQVPVNPEGLAVHNDLIIVAGGGGFLSSRLRAD